MKAISSNPVALILTLSLAVHATAIGQVDAKTTPTEAPARRQLTTGPRIPCSAIIHGGHSLAGDGLGPYRDGANSSSVYNRQSLNLFAWNHVEGRSNKPNPTAKAARERYFVFDLSRPVEGSGSVKLSGSPDYLARFHVFWKYEDATHGVGAAKLHFMADIPIGATVESDRVEMWALIGGVQHVLQMGPWTMGKFSDRAAVNGQGTTKATITRQTADSWRIKAQDDSIARLWDYSDIRHPIDKGLYYFSFEVEFSASR